jgi:hypothetical protein
MNKEQNGKEKRKKKTGSRKRERVTRRIQRMRMREKERQSGRDCGRGMVASKPRVKMQQIRAQSFDCNKLGRNQLDNSHMVARL